VLAPVRFASAGKPTFTTSLAISLFHSLSQERPWSTTRNQDARHYIQLMNLPLLVLCGNR